MEIIVCMVGSWQVGTPEKSAPHSINFMSDNETLHNAPALKQINCFYGYMQILAVERIHTFI